MIRQFLELPPFVFITVIVQGQVAIAAAMSCVIALLLLRRTRHQAWIDGKRAQYSEKVVEEMILALEDTNVARQIERPRRAAERAALKLVLLDHLRSVSGSEREFLTLRYEELGFVEEDLAALHSPFWWRRLRAASDLASLESRRFAFDFARLARDRHELVSAFGFYALSGLRHDINQPFPVGEFPISVRSRRNLMTEILRNWAKVYGAHVITNQIALTDDADLLESLVTAASTTLTIETSGAFGSLLGRRNRFPPEVLEGMLQCLRRVGDPQFVDVVRKYLTHKNEVVRLRALEYLVAMGEDDVLSTPAVTSDRSVAVRRALERWRGEGRAA